MKSWNGWTESCWYAFRWGEGGCRMIPSMPKKIRRLAEKKKKYGYHFRIGVDGGLTLDNATEILDCGAEYLVCGTTLFASPDMGLTAQMLRRLGCVSHNEGAETSV